MKSLVRHGSVYMVGIILGRVVSFLILPVYTNYLTPDDYGLLQLLSLTTDAIATIFGIDMASAITRAYHRCDDDDSRSRVLSSTLIGTIAIMGTVSLLCILFAGQFSNLIFGSGDKAYYFQLAFVAMFLASGIELPMLFLRIQLRSTSFVAISALKLVIQLSLNVLFLVVLGIGVVGILYSNIIATSLFAGYLCISAIRRIGFKFDWSKYVEVLKVGLPLILSGVSAFTLTYSDRYFLNYLSDLSTVGIYSLAYTFGMILSVVVTSPFVSVWGTEQFRFAKLPDGKAIFSRVLNYYLLAALFVSLGLSLLTKDALRIMANAEYWGAYQYVPLISVSYILFGVMYVAGAGILIQGKTKYRALSTALAAIANLGLNFLLIPIFGAFGAAFAAIGSFVVRVVIDVYYSQRLFPIEYDIKRIVHMCFLFAVLLLGAIFVEVESVVLSIAFNSLAVFLFPILVYFTGVLDEDERLWIRRLLKSPVATIRGIRGGISAQPD